MSYDPDDLGLDLERVKTLPFCHGCRKTSDGCKKAPDGTILCGTHFDEWAARRYMEQSKMPAADFARELREGRYRPCWDAKLDE